MYITTLDFCKAYSCSELKTHTTLNFSLHTKQHGYEWAPSSQTMLIKQCLALPLPLPLLPVNRGSLGTYTILLHNTYMYLFLTRQRITQRASCRERSASSSTNLLDPRTTTETVRAVERVPVIYIISNRKHVSIFHTSECCIF